MHKSRKYILLVFFMAGLCLSGAALLKGQPLNYGLSGGITVSQVDGDSYRGFNKLGGTAGVFMNSHLEYNIFWQAEIQYQSRGVYKGPTDTDQTLYKSSYHYVALPLSVHYQVKELFLVEAGSSPEVLIREAYWDENGIMDPENYPQIRRFGLSVFAGLGYWLNQRMRVGLRYTHSALPFRDPQEWNHPRYRGYFHSVLSLSLAYRLNRPGSGT